MSLKSVVRSIVITFTVVPILALTGCASAPTHTGMITVDGSLNVKALAEKLATDFITINPEVNMTIHGSSTAEGIKAVNAGTVDISGASRDLKTDEPKLVTHLFARDGIAIIVHPSNMVNGLSMVQIRDIFAGKITNWKLVGGTDQTIHVVTREEATSTRTVIEEMIMQVDNISSNAIIKLSNEEQKGTVLENPQAIGYNPFASSLDGSVKALDIDGVEATKDNAKNGTYPLVRPLYFLTKAEPAGLVKAYIDHCLSDKGQKLVADLGYVPVR
ncbi:phosphate ABC transporter substrate-binding protein [Chloroflexota bacterium]